MQPTTILLPKELRSWLAENSINTSALARSLLEEYKRQAVLREGGTKYVSQYLERK